MTIDLLQTAAELTYAAGCLTPRRREALPASTGASQKGRVPPSAARNRAANESERERPQQLHAGLGGGCFGVLGVFGVGLGLLVEFRVGGWWCGFCLVWGGCCGRFFCVVVGVFRAPPPFPLSRSRGRRLTIALGLIGRLLPRWSGIGDLVFPVASSEANKRGQRKRAAGPDPGQGTCFSNPTAILLLGTDHSLATARAATTLDSITLVRPDPPHTGSSYLSIPAICASDPRAPARDDQHAYQAAALARPRPTVAS